MTTNTLIVYVHGALSTRQSWNYIHRQTSDRLNKIDQDGVKPAEEFIKYNLNRELSVDIVERMVERITSLLTKKDFKKLILIGHSFGGVLSVATARALSEFLDDRKIKTRLITLSAPFAGSEIAAVLRIFKPGSLFFKNVGDHTDFIKDFKKQKLPYKTHIFVTTEGSADWMTQDNDGVVTVDSQSHFKEDPNGTHQEAKVNHFEILLSDLVVTQILKDLK